MDSMEFNTKLITQRILGDLEKFDILTKSFDHDGWEIKEIVSIEELAELQQAITKDLRNPSSYSTHVNLLEEMADVYICLEYIKMTFSITEEEMKKAISVKLEREKERIDNIREVNNEH